MDKIKYLITNWIEKKLPNLYEREFNYSLLNLNKIVTFIGVRRSGKTTYLFQIMKYLIKQKIPRNNLIYLNFEDDRLYPLDGNELNNIMISINDVVDYNKNKPLYLLLDEIQNMPNWSKWLRRIQDTNKNLKIIVTGSSAKLLSREIATELSGRTISLEIYPFSFKEYLNCKKIKYNLKSLQYSKDKIKIVKEFNIYLNNGGFPELIFLKKNQKIVLQGYFESIFYKDLVHRYNIKSINMFEDFLKLLISNTSNIITLSKLENTLKKIGHKVSKSTLSEYLNYVRDVYFLFPLRLFSYKIKDQLVYPKKIYSIDNGLINAISLKFTENKGALLENIVFLELKRKGYEFFYYITKNNLEIDFLIKESLNFTQLIQVCLSLKNEDTKNREIKALIIAMKELNLKEGLIITLNEKERIKIEDKIIKIVPIYEFLLK